MTARSRRASSSSRHDVRGWRHFLLIELDGDWHRLSALLPAIEAEIAEIHRESRQRSLADKLRRRGSVEFKDRLHCWQRALTLTQLALELVEQAGANHDDKARRVLVAGSKHLLGQMALGPLGMADDATQDFLDDLDKINRHDKD